jgi:hypothetical protein
MKKIVALIVLVVLLAAAGFVGVKYYSWVFSKKVQGQIVKVERVNQNETIISGGKGAPASMVFSFAVAIRDDEGKIHTASSEDRQWAVAQAGQCVQARLFPYPPWDLESGGTYFNARLLQLYDCPKK